MKKILLVLLLALIFTGCASIPAEGENGAEGRFESGSSEGREYGSSSAGIPGDYPGTYTVPEGWVKSKEHSSAAKFFYVKAGQEKDAQPDNILVNAGKNKYSVQNHEEMCIRDRYIASPHFFQDPIADHISVIPEMTGQDDGQRQKQMQHPVTRCV